ncbi:MAG: hypothetical protein E7477_00190 [Ruminococcaceae bacterium]|nr:hypothetical protein [Oscillospiraceae bacterium]
MAKLNFEKIIPLFEASQEFSLTESQYEKSVGKALPKDYYYLKNKSALAKEAKKYGYQIEIKEKTVCLKKAV